MQKSEKPLIPYNETFHINLSSECLFGWETKQYDRIVASICRGIELGDEFPPVGVYCVNPCVYELSGTRIKYRTPQGVLLTDIGGHHRAVAHYIMGKPLLAISKPREKWLKPAFIDSDVRVDERWCTHDITNSTFMDTAPELIEQFREKGFMYRDV
jgi:hypothetical protein